jgi:viologen exporter family transport system permease protein
VISVRAILSQVRIGVLTPWAYRRSMLLSWVLIAVQVALFTVVWRAIYRGQPALVAGADVDTTVGYAVLAITLANVINVWPGMSIESRVRDGLIGTDLMRPLGLLTQVLAVQAGYVIAALPSAAISLTTGLLVGGLAPPASPGAAVAFAASLVLAFWVAQLITLLMSLTSFWTLEVGGLSMTFEAVRSFLSGAIVPLWFMPSWLRVAAGLLPFQAATYTPLAVYFGRPPGGLVTAMTIQVLWVAVLGTLCGFVWSRARHRVVVQGG